jgi:hypothetical protein
MAKKPKRTKGSDTPQFRDPYDYLCLGLIEARNARFLQEIQEGKPQHAIEFLKKCNNTPPPQES